MLLSRRTFLTGAGVLAVAGCTRPPSAPPVQRPSSAPPRPKLELGDLEREFKGRIGAWALDMATGVRVGWREDERFPLCSTFKALAAAAVVTLGGLDQRVRWTAKDVIDYSPVTGKHVEDGLTLAELCEAAVTVSDNTAGNLLLRRIGGPAGLTRWARQQDDTVTRLDRWEPELNDWAPGQVRDTTTPAAIGGLVSGIAVRQDEVLGWMRASTTGAKRIRAGLPREWTVGDKTGTGGTYGTAHDVAIAHPPGGGGPLVLAVFTNRADADAAPDEGVLARTAERMAGLLS